MDQIRLHWIDGQVASVSGVAIGVVGVGLMTFEGDFPFCALQKSKTKIIVIFFKGFVKGM